MLRVMHRHQQWPDTDRLEKSTPHCQVSCMVLRFPFVDSFFSSIWLVYPRRVLSVRYKYRSRRPWSRSGKGMGQASAQGGGRHDTGTRSTGANGTHCRVDVQMTSLLQIMGLRLWMIFNMRNWKIKDIWNSEMKYSLCLYKEVSFQNWVNNCVLYESETWGGWNWQWIFQEQETNGGGGKRDCFQ